jgi:redox-regulated HSP33 family molecular chaperone
MNDAEKLSQEYANIQKNFNPQDFLASGEDLPDLTQLQIYDYNTDIEMTQKQAEIVLKELVDLYLGDSESIKNHNYIKTKMQEDAGVYAESILLSVLTRKLLLHQMKQIDGGDWSPRMYEVVNQTLTQVRENNKYNKSARTEIEKFYKDMRKDMGLNEITQTKVETNDSTDKVFDVKDLNSKLDEYLKNR